MRKLVIGPRNSGKSVYAEELMLQLCTEPIAYIATLPPAACSAERIRRHQARRGKDWKTWEMKDNPFLSLHLIHEALRGGRHVLLDGASILVWRTCVFDGVLNELRAAAFLSTLTKLLAASKFDWILVDSSMPYPHLGIDDSFNRIVIAHHHIWSRLTTS